jgi:hypothetical protein
MACEICYQRQIATANAMETNKVETNKTEVFGTGIVGFCWVLTFVLLRVLCVLCGEIVAWKE